MTNRPTPAQARMERALGVSHAGLKVLARLHANAGAGRSGGMAGEKLIAQGYALRAVSPLSGAEMVTLTITVNGCLLLKEARRLGW